MRPDREVTYYGEDKLRYADASPRQIARARMLLRFVAEVQPAYVWFSPGLPEIYREAIRYAGCVVRVFDGKVFPDGFADADMVVVDGSRLKKKDLQRFLRPGRSFAGFDLRPSFIDSIVSAMKGGVVVDGAGSLLVVSTDDSQVHSYAVSRF